MRMGMSWGASLAGSPWPDSVMTVQGDLLTAMLAGTNAVEVPTLPVKMPPRDGIASPPGCSDCHSFGTMPVQEAALAASA